MHNNNIHGGHDTTGLRAAQLRSIAGDLTEVHCLLSALCRELEGGGIVQARHLEPVIAEAVPRLSQALAVMNAMAAGCDGPLHGTGPERNPLLM